MLLIDFSDAQASGDWQAIGDRVMGGVSQSVWLPQELSGAACAVFTGVVSLANNGGFASVRSPDVSWDLREYRALRLTARGDGRTYKLSLSDDAAFDSVQHQSMFAAFPGDWQCIDLPFSGFVARRRGRTLIDAPRLDCSAIRRLGLMTELRQGGPFRLELLRVEAV
ncbi:CIA30 family protein [Rhodocyclus tenuis]|uniref:CIA30 family protein n=2 Tax=Rhodocyclus TaxID=1064 RepID=A0A6L5JUF2_RHOTE|nr:CIA30 family protein [Rhodocyclus gracilis]MQY50849.1 CIA30 family protein [Rhodocyclus gracilis]MRD72822.1 CIA30 family protein [Rhodocyclus gracilis]NJA90228.1 CIA30 family protein [Rhodocyclus gracilis]